VKQNFALNAEKQSRELLDDALKKMMKSHSANEVKTIQVLNTNSWPRNDLIILPPDWKLSGRQVRDSEGNVLPSQLLSDGSLAFYARHIPALGSAVFIIDGGTAAPGGKVTVSGTSLRNEFVSVEIDPNSGVISSIRTIRRNQEHELVDVGKAKGLNEYFYVAGRDPSDPQPAGKPIIRIKENGPLLVSLLIESTAPGCNKLTREIRLISGINRIDILNTVDKENIYEQEGIHFAFPFHVPQGQMRIDVGWGHYRPEADQIPGSCKNYLTVQRWVDISNQDYGVTWVTNDAPLIEVGQITSDPVAFGWIDHLSQSQKLYSYVMNNYWETNYKASQEGPVTFRYSIQPHGRFNPSEADRFGVERSQPLLVTKTGPKAAPIESLLKIKPTTVVLTSIQPLGNGNSLLVRLFNAGARPENVCINSGAFKIGTIYLSSPAGEKGLKIDGTIEMPALGIRTLLLEQGKSLVQRNM
jgi:alpha-mannosidase